MFRCKDASDLLCCITRCTQRGRPAFSIYIIRIHCCPAIGLHLQYIRSTIKRYMTYLSNFVQVYCPLLFLIIDVETRACSLATKVAINPLKALNVLLP